MFSILPATLGEHAIWKKQGHQVKKCLLDVLPHGPLVKKMGYEDYQEEVIAATICSELDDSLPQKTPAHRRAKNSSKKLQTFRERGEKMNHIFNHLFLKKL